MKLLCGTSGFSYKEWKGPFYPEKHPANKMLEFYGQRFPTVEINNTFYRLPKKEMLENWKVQVPADFQFVLKASRRITHNARLKIPESESPLTYLWETAQVLGDNLGPILFQLPPFLKKDLDRLLKFLDHLPTECHAAFEFRHPSWFDGDIYAALGAFNAALVCSDTDKDEGVLAETADWGYLRLRKEHYSEDEMSTWLKRIQDKKWEQAFVFFKHEDDGVAPKLAQTLVTLQSR